MSIFGGSVEQLCHNVGVKVARNEELESLIDPLLTVCCGPREDTKNPVLKVLNSEDLLLSILKLNQCSEILKDKVTLCTAIIRSLLSLSRQKEWGIIISLLKIAFESDLNEKDTLIEDIWIKQEHGRMPAEVVLILCDYEPALIEKQLCNLYCKTGKTEDIWHKDCFQCWIFWCSESAELFFIVSSILNQFLIVVDANSLILKIVNKFITNVMAECERNKRSILSFYPPEYQSLIALLMIEPDINPHKNTVIRKIILTKNVDTNVLLSLLSHFPLWMDVLNNM